MSCSPVRGEGAQQRIRGKRLLRSEMSPFPSAVSARKHCGEGKPPAMEHFRSKQREFAGLGRSEILAMLNNVLIMEWKPFQDVMSNCRKFDMHQQ
jgi:hypothetical protein